MAVERTHFDSNTRLLIFRSLLGRWTRWRRTCWTCTRSQPTHPGCARTMMKVWQAARVDAGAREGVTEGGKFGCWREICFVEIAIPRMKNYFTSNSWALNASLLEKNDLEFAVGEEKKNNKKQKKKIKGHFNRNSQLIKCAPCESVFSSWNSNFFNQWKKRRKKKEQEAAAACICRAAAGTHEPFRCTVNHCSHLWWRNWRNMPLCAPGNRVK